MLIIQPYPKVYLSGNNLNLAGMIWLFYNHFFPNITISQHCLIILTATHLIYMDMAVHYILIR